MIVAIRTVCTEQTGMGHLRRCLTLASAIAARVVFLLVADARGRALAEGEVIEVAGDLDATIEAIDRVGADALVCDDYALTPELLAKLHARVPKLLAIDDWGGALDVDAVLNANPAAPHYDVPLALVGPRYALLRSEFRGLPAREIGQVERVLVTLGGSDPGGRTAAIADAVRRALPAVTIDIVVGPLAGDIPGGERVVVHRSPRDMAGLMLQADLAICAGGQTTYELAACGVPAVALCVAENQRANLEALAAVPTLIVANDEDVIDHAVALAGDRARREQLARAGQQLVDGRGAERAWQALATRWSTP